MYKTVYDSDDRPFWVIDIYFNKSYKFILKCFNTEGFVEYFGQNEIYKNKEECKLLLKLVKEICLANHDFGGLYPEVDSVLKEAGYNLDWKDWDDLYDEIEKID